MYKHFYMYFTRFLSVLNSKFITVFIRINFYVRKIIRIRSANIVFMIKDEWQNFY